MEGRQILKTGRLARLLGWLPLLMLLALLPGRAAIAAGDKPPPMPDLATLAADGTALDGPQFLAPREAFALKADGPDGADAADAADGRTLHLHFDIAPGYYLYRERIAVHLDASTKPWPVSLPQGESKQDPTFGHVQVFHHKLAFDLPLDAVQPLPASVRVSFQGCADGGICYPPDQAVLSLSAGEGAAGALSAKLVSYQSDSDVAAVQGGGVGAALAGALAQPAAPIAKPAPATATASKANAMPEEGWWQTLQDYYDSPQALFDRDNSLLLAGIFFVLGVLLSLTPCVLPMLPILSAILTRQHGQNARPGHGFLLSLAYSVGVMAVYTLLGVLAGLAGQGLAPLLQTPWVMGVFASVMALLALSMFGVYELRLPHKLSQRLDATSRRLPGGQYGSVLLMGGVSALLVSPCVSAPLAGAMLFISQSQDVLLGGLALMMLSLGMCVPLLLLGASAGWLLPRAGAWMDGVKVLFGFMLLAVALYMIQPFIPTAWTLAGAGTLLLMAGYWLRPFAPDTDLSLPLVLQRALALLLLALGLMQWVGVSTQGRSVLQPLSGLSARAAAPVNAQGPVFQPVDSVADFDARVAQANKAGQRVVLDFYADWCVSCVEMDEQTFPQPDIAKRLGRAVLLRADVTAMTPPQRELLRRFRLFGPPGLIFIDLQGREQHRVVGFQPPARFERSLAAAGL
ncbi:protein-disulfide reductase DsbD [Amphibiibacter pelophylacis]|uniref:Protein-disulfide reductase DsbD n=1 Tax=Amphibiibacter pelophylacis TaxID=1799477 RepID=A0ACC6P539_9BURK